MLHNFKYTLKTLFKNKILIFWTFAFPLIMATFFNMAFKNITNSEKLDIIDIAVVNNEEYQNNEIYRNTLEQLSDSNEDQLFNIVYVDEQQAKELLNDNKITGYIKLEETTKIVFKENGINETILKYVTEEIEEKSIMIKNLSEQEIEKEIKTGNYNINYDELTNKIKGLMQTETNIKDVSSKKLDYAMIEYYTLIAMACLYGGTISMNVINKKLPNMCNIGKRISVSPTKKKTTILSSLISSYITQLIGLALLFIYTIFILKVDYGTNTPLIILLGMVGSLTGLSLGLLIGITMLGCFLSGMMGITMKYIIDKNIPLINKLNPAAIITDGFYSLYYYDTLDRYWYNIISLLIISLILILISANSLRRQKYDNI